MRSPPTSPTNAPSPPRISVIVPCHDLGETLDQALDSVFAQTVQDFEIVVVDDGSEDAATRALLAGLDRPRTRLLRIEHSGLPAARNAGIRATSGDLVCCLDADDLLEPGWFEAAVEALDEDPTIAFVSHWIRAFGDETWEWKPERCDLVALLDANTVNGASLVRRRVLLDVGLYDESLTRGCEDWELWMRAVERGHRGVILPAFHFRYRRRPGSLSYGLKRPDIELAVQGDLIDRHEESYRRHLPELLARQELFIGDLEREIFLLDREWHRWWEPELARRRSELATLKRRLAGDSDDPLKREIRRLEGEVAALRASASWRLTAPLRAVYDWARRLAGRSGEGGR